MKLISNKSTKELGSIVCEEAIFDTSLINNISFDADEQIIVFDYDGSEFGNPLDLPMEPEMVKFNVKVANNNLLITAYVTFPENFHSLDICKDGFGEVDFTVRLTQEETLTLSILLLKKSIKLNKLILNNKKEKKGNN
ncbi:MAG: hypothetical protein ACI4M6_05840 [Christensenellaceae bacterium]